MAASDEAGAQAHKATRSRALSDYVVRLESLSYAQTVDEIPESPAADGGAEKRSACGLDARSGYADSARQFAQLMQDMLGRSLSAPSTLRIRIFDDFTITKELEEGLVTTFSESRCSCFRRLRAAAGLTEEEYRDSMCAKPFLGGNTEASGKSGSLFLRSHDERFVLKTIEEDEFQVLKEILPNYVLYLEENAQSLLCRFYGAYSLQIGQSKLCIVVMANVLQRKAQPIYDLKGTTEDRWVDADGHKVLKDLNFAPHQILLEAGACRRLRQVITDDAEFLESSGLMDYSLLVGVSPVETDTCPCPEGTSCVRGWLGCDGGEPAEHDFQLGIIDYLQRWTPKKVAAHWLKKPTIGCCHEIDTEPPTKYCSRFCKFFLLKIQEKK